MLRPQLIGVGVGTEVAETVAVARVVVTGMEEVVGRAVDVGTNEEVRTGAATHTLWPGKSSAHARPGLNARKLASDMDCSVSILLQ